MSDAMSKHVNAALLGGDAAPSPAAAAGRAAHFFALAERIGRLRYFCYTLLGMVGCALLLIAIYLFALLLPDALGKLVADVSFILVKNVVVPLVVFVMSIRRLHDLGRSGWWALMVLIPFATVILLWVPGERDTNGYGPPPPPNPASLWVIAMLGPAAILALYFYMVDVNTGLERPGAPVTRPDTGRDMPAASPAPSRLSPYR